MENLSRLLKFDPSNRLLRQNCIQAAIQARDYQAVITLADEVLVSTPDDVEMAFAKSNGLIGLNDFTGAGEVLRRIQALDPLNPAIGQNLGLCLYASNDYAGAREQLEAVYAAGIRTVDVVRLLVSSLHHVGHMDRALEVADENRELARTDGALSGVYSLLYTDASRVADAKKFSIYALRSNPENIDALTTDATLRVASGDVDEAKEVFEKVLARNPNVGRAHLGVGSIALLKRDFAKAKADLIRALECMPGHIGTWHALGWAYLVTGELDEAERAFDRAMDIDRNFAETHGALASIAAMKGNRLKAEELARVALRLDPESLAARFAQSVLATSAGNPQESQRIIATALMQLISSDKEGVTKMMMAAGRKDRK
jgi:tetratricopeptide (TPR) repeat protein